MPDIKTPHGLDEYPTFSQLLDNADHLEFVGRSDHVRGQVGNTINCQETQQLHPTERSRLPSSGSVLEGDLYNLDGKTYLLGDDNNVYLFEFGKRRVIVDPNLIEKVEIMREHNEDVLRARKLKAFELGCEDPILEEILRLHFDFTEGKLGTPLEREGIKFYQAGENDWLSFYAGTKAGKRYCCFVSKEGGDETVEEVYEWGYLGDQKNSPFSWRAHQEKERMLIPVAERGFNSGRGCLVNGHSPHSSRSFQSYTVGDRGYCVWSDNGEITDREDKKVVRDIKIIRTIEVQDDEDQRIEQAREEIAEDESKGDNELKGVLLAHLGYNEGKLLPTEKFGVILYQVGRNASHDFYIGVKDGKRYTYSVGESYYDEEKNEILTEEHFSEVDEWGYVGHH